jgi:hypothetical protein
MVSARREFATKPPLACLMLAGLVLAGCASTSHTRAGSVAASSLPPASAAPTGEAGAALLAGEVQRELAAMRTTHYQHTTDVDEATGKFFYDCSGMLDYALGRVLPADVNALPKSTSKRPLAGDIEHHLHSGLSAPIGGWQSLTRVDQLGPGDVVAWLATEDSTTGDTGHVMVVFAAPTQNPARADEWLVKVGDSTLNPHAHDSRHEGESGLGTGTIGLVVDDRNAATAFYWRGGVTKQSKPTEIALGRPL